jgi:hypothetical protein
MHPVRLAFVYISLTLGGIVGSSSLLAQALPTAQRAAEITAFGGYTMSNPDQGVYAYKGFLAGANFTIFPHWFIDPSVETRFTYASSTTHTEHSFVVGPRLQKDFHNDRLHPYADVLIGVGVVSYHPEILIGDAKDSGVDLVYGGGIDIDVTRHISLKLDAQRHNFNLGVNAFYKPDGSDYLLTPSTFSVGATYHFPFAGLRKQRELR